MIIVNADDFGRSSAINSAIMEAFNKGICSSTTIMPNSGAFEEACQLVMDNKLNDRTGIHITLIGEPPLTDGIKKFPRFCDSDGRFVNRRQKGIFTLSADERDALAGELRAQIALCRQKGLRLTHADSHHHMHEEWALAPVFMRICKEEKIPFLRLTRNCGVITTIPKTIYRNILNYRFRRKNLARTDYFGSAADFKYLLEHTGDWNTNKSIEIMIHPAHKDGVLIDSTDGLPLSILADLLKTSQQPISFAGC